MQTERGLHVGYGGSSQQLSGHLRVQLKSGLFHGNSPFVSKLAGSFMSYNIRTQTNTSFVIDDNYVDFTQQKWLRNY